MNCARHIRERYLLIVLIALSVVFVSIGVTSASSGVALVEDGQPRFIIITDEDPSPTTMDAVNELNYWIKRISGVELPVHTIAQWDGTPYIAVGPSLLVTRNGWDDGPFDQEEARVFIAEDRIGLIGNDSSPYSGIKWTGTYYAVLEFVQKELGVRWIWPGEIGEVFTPRSTIAVNPGSWTWAPDITLTRGLRVSGSDAQASRLQTAQAMFGYATDNPGVEEAMQKIAAEQNVWVKRQRMNRATPIRFGHSFTNWWDRYGATNPDWFAQHPDGGVQLGGPGVKLNLSNPEVQDKIIDDWFRAYRANPEGNQFLRVVPNDSRGFDTRPETRAWDHPSQAQYTDREIWSSDEPILSDRYLKFWNIIARRAKELAPEVRVTTYAYRNYRHPPLGDERVEDNIIIGYVGGEGYYPDERFIVDEWGQWANKGATLTWRPNLFHSGHGTPYLFSRALYEDFDFFRKNNMRGTDFDSITENWLGQGLNYYVVAEQHNRPEASYEELAGEYFDAFGPASQAVKAYHEFMEERTSEVPQIMRDAELVSHETWGGWWPAHVRVVALFLTEEVVAQAEAMLEEASEAVRDAEPIYRRRVDLIRTGLEHAKLMAEAFRALGLDNRRGSVLQTHLDKRVEILQPLWDFRRQAASNYLLPVVRYLTMEQERLDIWGPFTRESHRRATVLGAGGETAQPLDEGWLFRVDPTDVGVEQNWQANGLDVTDWTPIDVGQPWREALSDIAESQIGWYRYTLQTPGSIDHTKTVQLHFGSVDAEMKLWFDGELISQRAYPHMGNYDSWIQPFAVDISDKVQSGSHHEIVVRVESRAKNAGITGPVTLVIQDLNLLANPGFEDVDASASLPNGWNTSVFDKSDVEFSVDDDTVRTGAYSVRIDGKASKAAPRGPRGALNQQVGAPGFEPGLTYRLMGSYRTEGVTRADAIEMRLSFRDRSGKVVRLSEDPKFDVLSVENPYNIEGDQLVHIKALAPAEDEWKDIELVFTAPESAANVRVELFLWRDEGTVWWDDIALVEIPTPTISYIIDALEGPREVAWFGTVYRPIVKEQSEGWEYESGEPGRFFGDDTRKLRAANTTEYLVYETPHLYEVALDMYVDDPVVDDVIEVYASGDGTEWRPVKYTTEQVARASDGLTHVRVHGVAPARGMNHAKIVLKESEIFNEIRLGQVSFRLVERTD